MTRVGSWGPTRWKRRTKSCNLHPEGEEEEEGGEGRREGGGGKGGGPMYDEDGLNRNRNS